MGEGAGGLAHLLSTAEHGVRSNRDEEVVILTQVRRRGPGGGRISRRRRRPHGWCGTGRIVMRGCFYVPVRRWCDVQKHSFWWSLL